MNRNRKDKGARFAAKASPQSGDAASTLTLISHKLCPYVQRAAISLHEKGAAFDRTTIDLAAKPDWFRTISPLGKVPLLRVGQKVIFESAVILEYLEDTVDPPLHPADALERADHRAWIEYGSVLLNDIAGFYNAPDEVRFEASRKQLADRFSWLERRVQAKPWFDGARFSLVDTVFGPVFRYFDTFDDIGDFGILDASPRVRDWRQALSQRPSVRQAVDQDYAAQLCTFLHKRNSHLSRLMHDHVDASPGTDQLKVS